MEYFNLLTICISVILGFCGVSTIFVTGWVKSTQLLDLRLETEKSINILKSEISSLWEKLSKVEVLATKLESVEKGVDEIKEMLRAKNAN